MFPYSVNQGHNVGTFSKHIGIFNSRQLVFDKMFLAGTD